jgi:hypothetical protein
MVCNHFSIHPSRQETLMGIVIGLMTGANVHHSSLSRGVLSSNPKSSLRRTERFFQKEVLSPTEYALSLVEILKFEGQFSLCLDRTNWRFGEKNINYLVLSWRVNQWISLPLLFSELDKAGTSNTQERKDLLDEFEAVFGANRIQSLMADREFIGKKWIEILQVKNIPFFIRVKENTKVSMGDETVSLSKMFGHLYPGIHRLIETEQDGSKIFYAATRAQKDDLVIVVTNQNKSPKKILDHYRKRWSIEEMFKKLKTGGLNWENTHMKRSPRLINLIIVLGIAAVLIYKMGMTTKIPWKKTLKCPLRSLFKQGLINFAHVAVKGLSKIVLYIRKMINIQKIIPIN